jgi:hypothetical protein
MYIGDWIFQFFVYGGGIAVLLILVYLFRKKSKNEDGR